MTDREAWSRGREAGATGGVNDESCARSHDPLTAAYRWEGRDRFSLVRAQPDVRQLVVSIVDFWLPEKQPFNPNPGPFRV